MSINHLNIEQATSSIEVVSSSVIGKLYELAQNPSLDSGSNVQGNLQVVHAYEDAVSYLLNKFPNLQINVTGGAYIRFADNTVLSILLNNLTPNDGIGITSLQTQVISNIGYWFYNSTITTFPELSKFTNLTYLDGYSNNDGKGAFRGCTNLQSIILPSSITELRNSVFRECTSLMSINLNNVTKIGAWTFNNCKALNINASALINVTSIGFGAFTNSAIAGELSLPNLTGTIQGFAYTNITKILDLGSATSMLDSDTFHEENASFSQCKFLTEANLPNTMTFIGGMSNCTALTKCLFSNSVTSIGQHAFEGDTALTTVGDCSGVVSINNSAFTRCLMLQSINLSIVCKTIAASAFKNCKALTSIGVSIESSLITVIPNDCFNGCNALITVGSLQNILTIGSNAFNSCYVLGTTMNLSSCTSIGDYAFYGCTNLTKVSIGTVCTKIDWSTFQNCTSLVYVKCMTATPPTLGVNVFTNTTCKIYVPDASVNAYKAATNWSAYASRIFSLTQFAIDFPNG